MASGSAQTNREGIGSRTGCGRGGGVREDRDAKGEDCSLLS